MERFLSAYHSKCLLRDKDGRKHCHEHFKLEGENVSLLSVAGRLQRYGRLNPHWALQGDFCGHTVREYWDAYTDHIPFHSLGTLVDVFAATNTSKSVVSSIAKAMFHPSRASHVTNSSNLVRQEESPELRSLLFDFYAEDYRMLLAHYRYDLHRRRTQTKGKL
jgi:hypothetical protein